MLTSRNLPLRIQAPVREKRSPARRQCNRMLGKLEKLRRELAQWQALKPRLEKQYHEELGPLLQDISCLHEQLVLHLDRFYACRGFSRPEREQMARFIRDQSGELIRRFGRNELKPLYDRYSTIDFDTGVREAREFANKLARSLFEHELGRVLDDGFDLCDPTMVEQLQAKRKQQQVEKTAREPCAAIRRQTPEEADITPSLKAVYRQLITILHPDREPDARERERKTELMQQLTSAYRARDLLGLLELQLAVVQVDQYPVKPLSGEHLKHFHTLLVRQQHELEAELQRVSLPLRRMVGLEHYPVVRPEQMLPLLAQTVLEYRQQRHALETALAGLTTVRNIRAWLADDASSLSAPASFLL
ncbi:MAG: hypothetical protein KDI44_18565 [Thiothrix sp.]|nr:hypothetical protein [Thiothrix sp.]HPQ95685.1 hypothetical protein [Thiolinea sp.]